MNCIEKMYGLRSRLFVLFNSYLLKPLRTIMLVTVNVMLQEDVLHLIDNSRYCYTSQVQ